ncbi:4-(cytidine 5'-diphospho)-2-C-methyl-D-erythritol kinase [Chitinimonas sp.]|uniref:4-(cytidine 5'-diphospho)-2-C-methyl-D-erythritol kinase n=1 Tax=Chitinimonas sp. TaxID=1934313 RepID=UPI0035AFE6B7
MTFHRFFAPAKINLFLHVTGRRADGYHLLQTAFRLLDYGDDIDIAINQSGEITHANPLPGVPVESDLVIRAARLLQAESGTALGGGSSDAATVLMALNHLWGLSFTREQLQALGLRLGADVPFFIFGRDAFAEGVGEQLQALALPEQCYLVLIPPVSVPTAEIFSSPGLTRNSKPIIMAAFPSSQVRNDLEAVAKEKYPIIADHLDWLSQFGKAMMTGSGACVFAAFNTRKQAESVMKQKPADMQGFIANSMKQHPLFGLLD